MRKVAQCGILISLALVLSYVERLIPLEIFVPLPGIKLGLANIVTIFALFYVDMQSAVIISVIRCILAAMLFGSVTSFLFSISGAFASLVVMSLIKRGCDHYFSIIGVGVGGAAAHNVGQIWMASFLLHSTSVYSYLTVLLVASIVTGLLTGKISGSVLFQLNKLHVLKEVKN